MAIFFTCPCGQALRADEAMAGGQKECPACGGHVPVPTLALDNRRLGIESVPTLELLPRPALPVAPEQTDGDRSAVPALPDADKDPVYRMLPAAEVDADQDLAEMERRRVRRFFARARRDVQSGSEHGRWWPRETHWYECLVYPMRAWPILLILAGAWATLTAILIAVWTSEGDWAVLAPLLLLSLVFCYTCTFYRCVLTSAAAGECDFVPWPKADVVQVLWTGAACLVSFLAGAVVPAAVAFWFWLNGGDLLWLDYLILGELVVVAVGSWILAFLAVHHSGRLRAANPVAVANFARQLEWRGWLAVVLATIGLLMQYWLILGAVELMHDEDGGPVIGWLVLLWWWFWGGAWVVFLLRWWGLSRYWAGQRPSHPRGLSANAEQESSRLPAASASQG
jgi:hypothetical protein